MKNPLNSMLAVIALTSALALGEAEPTGAVSSRPPEQPAPVAPDTATASVEDPHWQWLQAEKYARGEGVPKDMTVALQWYIKAAEQGHPDAQSKLGHLYISGSGVRKNNLEAARWLLIRADKGDAAAQCQVGRMHLSGAGVPKDDLEAYKWCYLSAAQGTAAAKQVLSFLSRRMSPAMISQATQRAMDIQARLKLNTPAEPVPPSEIPALPAQLD